MNLRDLWDVDWLIEPLYDAIDHQLAAIIEQVDDGVEAAGSGVAGIVRDERGAAGHGEHEFEVVVVGGRRDRAQPVHGAGPWRRGPARSRRRPRMPCIGATSRT